MRNKKDDVHCTYVKHEMRNLFQLCPRLPAGSNEKTGELYLKSEPRERCWLVQRSTQVPVTAVSTTTKLQFNAAFLVILIFACRSSCLVLMLPFIYMPFLMIVQKSVSCTALNLSLPEFLLPAGFNSDKVCCPETDDKLAISGKMKNAR